MLAIPRLPALMAISPPSGTSERSNASTAAAARSSISAFGIGSVSHSCSTVPIFGRVGSPHVSSTVSSETTESSMLSIPVDPWTHKKA